MSSVISTDVKGVGSDQEKSRNSRPWRWQTGLSVTARRLEERCFWKSVEQVVLWSELCALVEPVYAKAGNGRPPVMSGTNAADSFFAAMVQPV
jgi:hypothetical protein